MAFRQFKYENKNYSFNDILKDKAIKKLTNIKKEFQSEESEEEESSESYEISDENNSGEESEKK